MNRASWFLKLAKEYVRDSRFILVPREQNISYMASVGMSMEDLESVIFSLRAEDCFKGPEADDNPDRDKWTIGVFSPEYEGQTLYFKLGVNCTDKWCKCISVKPYVEEREG